MALDRIRGRILKKLAIISDSFSRLIETMKPTSRNLGSQRMCPFCRLIIPRAGRFCLECGKSFESV